MTDTYDEHMPKFNSIEKDLITPIGIQLAAEIKNAVDANDAFKKATGKQTIKKKTAKKPSSSSLSSTSATVGRKKGNVPNIFNLSNDGPFAKRNTSGVQVDLEERAEEGNTSSNSDSEFEIVEEIF